MVHLKELDIEVRSLIPLSIILVTFICVQTLLSWIRYSDFYAETWDLGINMQMLWNTFHGLLLYENADYSATGGAVVSFLQIHSTYIAIPVALVYGIFPTALTLFALQSTVVGFSGIPLFFILREKSRNPIFLYGSILVFFTNFALISGLLYDYHWEAFLPVEFFSLFWFVSKRQFRLAVVTFIVGCLTLEVFPFLMMGIILYFAAEEYGIGLFNVPKLYKERNWLIYCSMFALAILSYVAIRIAEYDLIPSIVGARSPVGNQLASSVFFLLSPAVDLTSVRFSFTYWALIYLSLGLVPLLYPKHLLLALPWLYETFFLQPQFATYFGNQYSIVALMSVFLGFAFGIAELESKKSVNSVEIKSLVIVIFIFATLILIAIGGATRSILGRPLSIYGGVVDALVLVAIIVLTVTFLIRVLRLKYIHRILKQRLLSILRPLLRYSIFIIVCSCILVGIVLSPLNPDNAFSTVMPGYWFSYSQNSAFSYMDKLVSYIPQNASVVAVTNLFPFIANHKDSYSFLWYSPQPASYYLPFNSSKLPDYVLVDTAQLGTVPPFLQTALLIKHDYGIRYFVYHVGFPGSIFLYQKSFIGQPIISYASQYESTQVYFGHMLSIGASGKVETHAESLYGTIIASIPANNSSGNNACIWFGPYITLMPGYYSVSLSLLGFPSNNSAYKSVPLVYLNSNGLDSPVFYSRTIYSNVLYASTWKNFTFDFKVTSITPSVEFRGYLYYTDGKANGYVALNYISLKMLAS